MNKNNNFKDSLYEYSRIVEDDNDDLALQFCTEVLGLESLHWGYWDTNEINLENLKKAQKNFTIHLASFIPEGVNQILDVGCGIGDNAVYLADKDYQLTCISPDVNHEIAFNKIENGKINFHLDTIENFRSDVSFDLALMSESSNYFDKDEGFQKLHNLIKDEGFVLSASLFRIDNSNEYNNFHIESEWLKSAENHGFKVVNKDDITDKVVHLCTLGKNILDQYAFPTSKVLFKYLNKTKGLKSKIFSYFLQSQFDKLIAYLDDGYVSHMCNADLFKQKARYIIYLLKKEHGNS